jgi:hypothetical protein
MACVVRGAEHSFFFAENCHEHDAAFGLLLKCSECPCDFNHGYRAAAIVVRAIRDSVAVTTRADTT